MKTVFSAGGLRPRARAARTTPVPGGWGAPATRQSGASANNPRWARGPRPLARAELTSPAPGERGTLGARQSGARAPGTRLVGGAPAARQSGVCAPGPRIPFLNLHTRAARAPSGQENRPHARAACATPATGGQGGLRLRIRAACVPPAPAWQGGSGYLPEHCVRPRPYN